MFVLCCYKTLWRHQARNYYIADRKISSSFLLYKGFTSCLLSQCMIEWPQCLEQVSKFHSVSLWTMRHIVRWLNMLSRFHDFITCESIVEAIFIMIYAVLFPCIMLEHTSHDSCAFLIQPEKVYAWLLGFNNIAC